jgi:hypothetical protein
MYNVTLFPNLFETFFKKFFNTLADSVLQGCIFHVKQQKSAVGKTPRRNT